MKIKIARSSIRPKYPDNLTPEDFFFCDLREGIELVVSRGKDKCGNQTEEILIQKNEISKSK